MAGHIDVHIHALPPAYKEAVKANGGDPSGFPEPEWSPEGALKSMEAVGSSLGIFSVSSPGVPITGTGEAGRQLARDLNTYLGDLSTASSGPHAGKFGFFGVLPHWDDVEGVLSELDFLYVQQKLCSGVGIYTNYDGKLPGHPSFQPIWARLQAYKALVHMHPTNVPGIQPRFIGGFLPQPIVDYPQDTTRAAVDLVITGTLRACPDVDVILSHAGGTLPYIAGRALGALEIPPLAASAGVTAVQAVEDMGRFFYDIALSTSPAQLGALLEVTDASHILYGSDYPYAPMPSILKVKSAYDRFVEASPKGQLVRPEVLRENAVALLNKHSLGQVFGDSTSEQKL